jgi:signal transduction histidine kinase
VRSLAPEEITKGPAVRVRGVVTLRDGEDLNIQDNRSGIWISVTDARRSNLFPTGTQVPESAVEGQEIEVEGLVMAGGYTPIVAPRSIRVIGPAKRLPVVYPFEPTRFFNGLDDCLLVEVGGVVQGYRQWGERWDFLVDANPGRFNVEIPTNRLPDPESLVDAVIRVRGVVFSRFNTRGEIMWPRLFLGTSGDLIVEEPALPLSEVPMIPLDQLRTFRTAPMGLHRVRVSGTVTLSSTDFFYIQQGERAVRIASRQPVQLALGDVVEAIGFVDPVGSYASLREAVIRKTGTAMLPEVLDVSPEDVIAAMAHVARTGVISDLSDLDGRVIRFNATLLAGPGAADDGDDKGRLLLQSGNMILGAVLQGQKASRLNHLQAGSKVQVTGIATIDFVRDVRIADYASTLGIGLLLRDPADVVVLRVPSWWKPARLLMLASVFAALLVTALLWVFFLRRQVTRQMEVISGKLRADTVNAERNRMARDLHDTLEQQLTGIALQIDGAKEEIIRHPAEASTAMDLASQMLRHTRLEARRSVWELRSQVLEMHGLETALRSLAESARYPGGPAVEFHASGKDQPLLHGADYQVLRVAQEALANAIKHAGARQVQMHLERNAEGLRLIVQDDGKGIDPSLYDKSTGTHFGILGMRERATRIGADVSIESRPGKGCTVTLKVPYTTM